MNCIIIEDEPIARKVLEEYIADIPYLQLVGMAGDPLKASEILHETPIDLMFLDILMPKMNGIEFLKSSTQSRLTIMTTAFPEFALEGYELDVTDYLVKPISFDRFLKACNKAHELFLLKQQPKQKFISEEYCFVKCNNKFEKLIYDDLLYIEAASNYVLIHTRQKRLITYITFKGIEEYLPSDQFIRVHKSYIVSLSKIESLTSDDITISNQRIPLSRYYKDQAMDRIISNKLIKR